MVYIIYSDVHSNLEALQTFLQITNNIAHDWKVCLGDIVGYGPDPNPCIKLVREHTDLVLAGNHDFAVLNKTNLSSFNFPARKACIWTSEQLTEENLEYLDGLPVFREENRVCWAHSSPFEPEGWHYIFSHYDGEVNFDHFNASVCFVGHTHVPLILEKNASGVIVKNTLSTTKLALESRYIVNVGSLGQPRDYNPNPAFGIFDSESMTIEFRRFSYDLVTTQEKIIQNGLPVYLAERLKIGQ